MFEIDSFYLIVLSIAVIILIIALGFMGWMLSHQKDDIKFPGITTTCPDFWTIDADGRNCVRPDTTHFNYGDNTKSGAKQCDADGLNCINPTNTIFGSYKPPGSSKWTNVPGWTAGIKFDSKSDGWGSANDAICNKKKWSSDNGILWDTVTNVNFC
jgi:hypothetical protein